MLVVERQQKIAEMVKRQKTVRVKSLSQEFSVTEETIRRDLEKLEKAGMLSRSHGGAVFVDNSDEREVPYFEREITNIAEKKEIARLAAKQIKENDTIILDASSTALYVARVLENMPLTIVTNSIQVAVELSRKDKINVISLGGNLQSKSLSFVGPLTEISLQNYHVNKAFLSCKSFHVKHGIHDSNELQARVKKQMIDHANEIYMMMDNSKINKIAFSHIYHTNIIDYVITNQKTNIRDIVDMEEQGLKVLQTKLSKM